MGLVEIKREVKTYYGVEYALILVGLDSGELKDTPLSEVNPSQWWVVEYTDKSKSLAEAVGNGPNGDGFIYGATMRKPEYRLQDKYHEMELKAINDINWLMSGGYSKHRRFLFKEIFYFFYVSIKIIPQRILFKIKKVIGNQA